MVCSHRVMGGIVAFLLVTGSPVMAETVLPPKGSSPDETSWQRLSPEEKLTVKQQVQREHIRQQKNWEQLSPEEKEAFQQRIKANEALRRELSKGIGR